MAIASAGSDSRIVVAVRREHEQERAEREHRGDNERLPRRDLAGGERPLRRALDVRIEMTIGPVVDRAAGGAHEHRAHHEDDDERCSGGLPHAASHSADSVGHRSSRMPIGLSRRISRS